VVAYLEIHETMVVFYSFQVLLFQINPVVPVVVYFYCYLLHFESKPCIKNKYQHTWLASRKYNRSFTNQLQ